MRYSLLSAVLAFHAATVFTMLSSVADEAPDSPRFTPHPPMLADAVREADVIFMGVTTRVDLTHFDANKREGTYSGTIIPQTFLKGSLEQREISLSWERFGTGLKPGSNHIFFVRIKNGDFKVVKEIFFDRSWSMSATYWVYTGGLEATLQTIRLLVSPSTPQPNYAATLLADLKQPDMHRQATAVMLACETMRPECLDPLLYAITHHVEDYVNAIYGACRLDGEKGATAALALIASQPDEYWQIFAAIATAKNAQSVPILEQFGADYPEYRASCAVAIGGIEPTKLADLLRRWHVDGKHGSNLRHFEGWVVKRSSGGFDVSNGFYCATFPKGKTAALAAYVGKFVDVTFSMAEDRIGFGRGGAFDEIQRITVIEDTSENFPFVVTIEPIKKIFTSTEPIIAKVILENRSKQVQSVSLTSSHAILSRDYEKVFWLEPDNHYYPEKSYRFEGKPDIGKLAPGGQLAFTIESRHMAEPGKYDLSYVLCCGIRPKNCVSELEPVEVIAAPDGDRTAVLRSWLKTAALEQRIKIANELAEKGDRWAVDEFLAQLKTGMYLGNGFFYHQAYEFPFRHGGEAGEKLMMDIIEHDKFQESATEFIRDAFISKNRLRLLSDLLSCQHAVEMNLQDWVKHPRICDIAADVLMQRTRGKMKFPREGSEKERDDAVARVQGELKASPQLFEGLKSD